MELKSCCKIWKAFKDKGTGVIILEDKDGNRLHYCPSRINGCPTCLKAFDKVEKTNKAGIPEELHPILEDVVDNRNKINELIRYLKAKRI